MFKKIEIRDDATLEAVELNCDKESFNTIIDVIGDYDYMKSENIYLEDTKLQ